MDDVCTIDIDALNRTELIKLRDDQWGLQKARFAEEFELPLMQAIDGLLAKLMMFRHTDNADNWKFIPTGVNILSYDWAEPPRIHLGDTLFECRAEGLEIHGASIVTSLYISINREESHATSYSRYNEEYEIVLEFSYTSHDITLSGLTPLNP